MLGKSTSDKSQGRRQLGDNVITTKKIKTKVSELYTVSKENSYFKLVAQKLVSKKTFNYSLCNNDKDYEEFLNPLISRASARHCKMITGLWGTGRAKGNGGNERDGMSRDANFREVVSR